ncbi:MAG: glycoside hydrolase family 2 TIM barrel-domain containing protein [Bacteroidota bacterium]|nr:glycoside hydrolase family 2 TIM barrel-domain containing protein [Bacteroidota bacterium]
MNQKSKNIVWFILVLAIFGLAFIEYKGTGNLSSEVVKVSIKQESDAYKLYCNNKEFFIKGAGLEFGNIESLAEHGGNSFRTWRTENGKQSGIEVLNKAHENGLMVCMGLEVGKERHGFDYNDEKAVKEQLEYLTAEVKKYKDHPALLMWGIGNELNLAATNPAVWDAVNDIAIMIHEIDKNHPVTTMLAGAGKEDVKNVMERCPDLDLLSFQIYGDIMNLPRYIEESAWDGPYIITEWGATGHWEVARTEWDRPIEQTSHEKAMAYKKRYEKVIEANPDQCLGSYVFLWGQKQERTPTWYGIFLETGEETEAVDVMHYVWNKRWPENKVPILDSLRLNGLSAYDNVYLEKGQQATAKAFITEPDDDPLQYRWVIMREVKRDHMSFGGDHEKNPEKVKEFSGDQIDAILAFEAPEKEGEYRLFVYGSDGNGNAATANIPFYVKKDM